MARLIVAALIACLYVAGSVWIVRNQGREYRDALRRERLAAAGPEKPSAPPDSGKQAPPVTTSVTRSPVPGREPAAAKPVAAPARSRPKKNEGEPPARTQRPVEVAKANPAAPRSDPPSPERKPAGRSAPANPLANNPIWTDTRVTRKWDLAKLKPDDELQLGADLHELIVQLNRPLDEGPYLRRVEEAAEPFRKTVVRKDITYTFTILDSDVPNAFSHPGGYVYVSRGLFDLIGEDEDYALQFAIGHEIAHVDLQHALKCLQDPGLMKVDLGTLQKLYLVIIPFGYLIDEKAGVDQEFEADVWTLNRMLRLGLTRREILAFLQKLDGHAKKHGFENGRAKPQLDRDTSPLENHYRSQTAGWKRLNHLKELMKSTSASP
jgi:hypothetical protein